MPLGVQNPFQLRTTVLKERDFGGRREEEDILQHRKIEKRPGLGKVGSGCRYPLTSYDLLGSQLQKILLTVLGWESGHHETQEGTEDKARL